MEYIALSPQGLRPRASVQYIPYIPCARVITITTKLIIKINTYTVDSEVRPPRYTSRWNCRLGRIQ